MTDPVNDLAAELRDLAEKVGKRLDDADESLRQHGGWISEAEPRLDEEFAEIWKQVNKLLEEMPRQPKYPPVCWLRLTSEEAADTWRDLGDWVEAVLVQRFFVTRAQLPDCWPLHPAAVEHLTWLRTAWLHAYLKTAGAVPAAEWHTRWLRDALTLVPAAVDHEAPALDRPGCGPGEHFGKPLPGHAPRPPEPPTPQSALPEWQRLPTSGNEPPPLQDPGRIGRHPSEELATRDHWQPQLLAASTADVQRRAEAEAAAQAAEAEERAKRDERRKRPADDPQEDPPPDD
jgi:hypothetical protein